MSLTTSAIAALALLAMPEAAARELTPSRLADLEQAASPLSESGRRRAEETGTVMYRAGKECKYTKNKGAQLSFRLENLNNSEYYPLEECARHCAENPDCYLWSHRAAESPDDNDLCQLYKTKLVEVPSYYDDERSVYGHRADCAHVCGSLSDDGYRMAEAKDDNCPGQGACCVKDWELECDRKCAEKICSRHGGTWIATVHYPYTCEMGTAAGRRMEAAAREVPASRLAQLELAASPISGRLQALENGRRRAETETVEYEDGKVCKYTTKKFATANNLVSNVLGKLDKYNEYYHWTLKECAGYCARASDCKVWSYKAAQNPGDIDTCFIDEGGFLTSYSQYDDDNSVSGWKSDCDPASRRLEGDSNYNKIENHKGCDGLMERIDSCEPGVDCVAKGKQACDSLGDECWGFAVNDGRGLQEFGSVEIYNGDAASHELTPTTCVGPSDTLPDNAWVTYQKIGCTHSMSEWTDVGEDCGQCAVKLANPKDAERYTFVYKYSSCDEYCREQSWLQTKDDSRFLTCVGASLDSGANTCSSKLSQENCGVRVQLDNRGSMICQCAENPKLLHE